MLSDTHTTEESAATRHSDIRSEQMRQYQRQTSKDDGVVVYCHANDPMASHLAHEQRAREALRDFHQKFSSTFGGATMTDDTLPNGSG